MAMVVFSGFISSILQEILDRIKASTADTVTQAYSSDVEEELKNLSASYIKAQSMLDTIDGWDLISSKPHRNWVADITRACYDTEDFTEHLELEILQKKRDVGFLKSYWTKWGASCKIRDLQSNMDRLIGMSDIFRATNKMQHLAVSSAPVVVPDEKIFKRRREKELVIGALIRASSTVSSCSDNSSIVLVEGMFGIGKTTLAQVVKNDPKIQTHFDYKIWESVSGEFDLGRTLCSMILELRLEKFSELSSRPSTLLPVQHCARIFQDLCKGSKVLIVLDDLCSFVKPQDWEDFHSLLLDPQTEFGVLITTRNPKVTEMVVSFSKIPTVTHHMEMMSVEDCSSLILHKADSWTTSNSFKRKHCGRSNRDVTALQIAEKFCKGLPLVANIIGRHLFFKAEERWPIVLSKDLWEMPEFQEIVFPDFRLNYSDLSVFLRKSFPYFSLFPSSYRFKKNQLIQLWLAEGFIKPRVIGGLCWENPAVEELESHYFDEVLSRSILQIYLPFTDDPKVYRMHEFLHRYAQYIGSGIYIQLDEQFVGAFGTELENWPNRTLASADSIYRCRNARHLSLLSSRIQPSVWKEIENCEGLRTILSLNEYTCIKQVSYTLFIKLQRLRVLDLSKTDISELPESIGKLKHLRLLDASETGIEELPESTSDLCRLLVLKLDNCPMLLQLPKGIRKLTHLLHLEVDIKGLSTMPPSMGKLSKLCTLRAFVVGRKEGYRLSELKNMHNLQGSICLTSLENVKDEAEAREAMLMNKPFLKRLELEWNRQSRNRSLTERILTALEPHENLKELQVTRYGGSQFPGWLDSPECNLTSIHLVGCDKCSILPAFGQIQHLKSLHIEGMHSVTCIGHEFFGEGDATGFPSLELLKIEDMMSLKKWVRMDRTHMPRLHDLVIADCPKLSMLPSLNHLTCLVNLKISSCPQLQALPVEGLPWSLEEMIIVGSDLLKRCCQPEQGSDWEKIKAVPKVIIDFKPMPTNERQP